MTFVLSPSKVVPETADFVTKVVSLSSSIHTPVLIDHVRDVCMVATVTSVVSAVAAGDCDPAAIEGVRSPHVDSSASTTATGPASVDVGTSLTAIDRGFPAIVTGSGISPSGNPDGGSD